jgi:hypothetical protein
MTVTRKCLGTFRRNLLSPSLVRRRFLALKYVTRLHSVMSQKPEIFIFPSASWKCVALFKILTHSPSLIFISCELFRVSVLVK